MSMTIIRPSAFWSAVRHMLSVRFAASLFIMFLCLEAVARVAPYIVGKHVHQPFYYSQELCETDSTNQGRVLEWKGNGRGARGENYRGQPREIAVFGSSTTDNRILDQDEGWPEVLRQALGAQKVHVDNFGRPSTAANEASEILEHLSESGSMYDTVLIMTHSSIDEPTPENAERFAFYYWGHWAPEGTAIESRCLLPKRLAHQISSEPRVRALVDFVKSPLKETSGTPPAHNPQLRSNREIRRKGQLRFVDYEASLAGDKLAELRAESRRLFQAAIRAANEAWFITQPIAYDEQEIPGVADQWFILLPAPGHGRAYRSNRSVAQELRLQTSVMMEEAERLGVRVIDLDGQMRPMLRKRNDLFEDRWHFSPNGARIAGQIIAEYLATP